MALDLTPQSHQLSDAKFGLSRVFASYVFVQQLELWDPLCRERAGDNILSFHGAPKDGLHEDSRFYQALTVTNPFHLRVLIGYGNPVAEKDRAVLVRKYTDIHQRLALIAKHRRSESKIVQQMIISIPNGDTNISN